MKRVPVLVSAREAEELLTALQLLRDLRMRFHPRAREKDTTRYLVSRIAEAHAAAKPRSRR